MNDSKKNHLDTTELTHIWTNRVWQHAQDLHKNKPDQIPTLRKGRGHSLLLTNNVFITDNFWERENLFSTR